MVMASGRWLGVRLDLLSSLLTGVVALAAILVTQDAGRQTVIRLNHYRVAKCALYTRGIQVLHKGSSVSAEGGSF